MPHIELSLNVNADAVARITNEIIDVVDNMEGIKIERVESSDNWTLTDVSDDTPHPVGRIMVDDRWRESDSLTLQRLVEVANKTAERQSISNHERYAGGERVRQVINELEMQASNTIANVHTFLDDAVVFLRAIELNAGGVLNAGSKGDMNARARGLIDLIRSVLENIADVRDSLRWTDWKAVLRYDPWRQDFGKSELVGTLHEVIAENKRLRERLGEPSEPHSERLNRRWSRSGHSRF